MTLFQSYLWFRTIQSHSSLRDGTTTDWVQFVLLHTRNAVAAIACFALKWLAKPQPTALPTLR